MRVGEIFSFQLREREEGEKLKKKIDTGHVAFSIELSMSVSSITELK